MILTPLGKMRTLSRRVLMKVADVMSHRLVTVSPKSVYKSIWSTFFKNNINALPVVDANKKLVGIIVKEDLLKGLYPNYWDLVDDFSKASDYEQMESKMEELVDVSAEDIMNRHVIFTRTETQLMRALSRMIAQRVNQLPVLNEDDQVIGMVTKGDIFAGLFKQKMKVVKSTKSVKLLTQV
jgi:CBS-domain-containing membrane protein